MTTAQKIERLKEFTDEKEFREFLIDFLKKRGFSDVMMTHRWGAPESGKDIIAKLPDSLGGFDWFSFVVKKGRIGGGTVEIETIKGQIKQSFEYPYEGLNVSKQKINKVIVITNENFTGGAQEQIKSSPELAAYNNFTFWWNELLIPMIDVHYSDFWLPGDAFAKEYSSHFTKKLNEEIEIRELSIRKIDDNKIQKLLDIFVEPKLTTQEIEEDKLTKEKSIKSKSVTIRSMLNIEENILLSGEQGSGKSKVLNSIACQLATADNINENKTVPVRLKAPKLRVNGFDIEKAVIEEVKSLATYFYEDEIFKRYRPILFIDDSDLLVASDKQILFDNLKAYCTEHNTHYVITYRKTDFDYEKGIKKIQIHNFNIKQIESFVTMYFDGTDRGQKFIRILRDSDLLSKLPTTPLTISLISLLYDENNFEIPATLSDIYSDFMSILLGKLEIQNRQELIVLNLKKRLFTALSLKMLNKKEFEITFDNFRVFINEFLTSRGYQEQTDEQLFEIIEKSGVLFIDDNNIVGFKQQAFIEFLASLEIYHNSRKEYYPKMIENFNDVNWQNTAIFFAGHSKELQEMIDDVIEKAPNKDLKDWFINSGGMGYLAQALYQTKPHERKKLVLKSLDNMLLCVNEIKKLSGDEKSFFANINLPLTLAIMNFWFNENFKSITLNATLDETFNELWSLNPTSTEDIFECNTKLLMIACTQMNPYIDNDSYLLRLMERENFMKHPILPLVANMFLEMGSLNRENTNKELKEKVLKAIKKKKEYIKSVLKEPAYRFNNDFSLSDVK